MAPQTFIFIGRSGCGKGTQAKLIENYLRQHESNKRPIYYLETGNRFREYIKGSTHSSELSREIYDRDDRQPEFLAVWIWSSLFVENLTGEEHLMIDGSPRSMPEALMLDNALDFYKRKANVIHLDTSRPTVLGRLLSRGQTGSRSDDKDATRINKRLDWVERDVLPVIEYYRNSPVHHFVEVDGEQPIEKVFADIVSKLNLD